MIRRPASSPELGLDSLTDALTNMMGLILLLVVITAAMSGGMRLMLLGELADPVGKTPVYLVCRRGRVWFMHEGENWRRALAALCGRLAKQLRRKPTASEAIHAANRRGLCRDSDLIPTFVREKVREAGREVFVVGVRFHFRPQPKPRAKPPLYSPAAARALARFDPARQYIDAFVYPSGVDAFKALQARAKKQRWSVGWRPMLSYQTPGLSNYGLPGAVGSEQ